MTHETLEPVSVSEISIKCGVCPFGLDIGGTLTKVAYYVEEDDDTFHQSNPKTEFPVLDSQGIWNSTDTVKDKKKKKCYLKFEYFDTNAIEKLVKWLKGNLNNYFATSRKNFNFFFMRPWFFFLSFTRQRISY
jgi:pantothenate kinase